MNNAEKSLIAILLNYPENFQKVRNLKNIFLDRNCQKIFSLMQRQKRFTKSTILSVLQENKAVTEIDFYEIYEYYYEVEQIDSYIDFVVSQYIRNSVISYAHTLKENYETYEEIKEKLDSISIAIDNTDEEIQNTKEAIQSMQEDHRNICKLVPSHLPYIDINGGLESTDYVIIAARPSNGKTTLALNLIIQDMKNNIIPGFFTTETNNKKIISLLTCITARIEEIRYRTMSMTTEEKNRLTKAYETLYEQDLYLDGTPRLYLDSLKRKARQMVREKKVGKIYIDYLQRIRCEDKRMRNNYEKITYISEELKALAVELEVPIICLAQLNRGNEKDGREPVKSDLRGSGDIEQDADIIILLHPAIENLDKTIDIKNIVAKYRNGQQGEHYAIFNKKLRRIKYTKI
jgi:replicative DNA helicase